MVKKILVVDVADWKDLLAVGLRVLGHDGHYIHPLNREELLPLIYEYEPEQLGFKGAIIDWFLIDGDVLDHLVKALQAAAIPLVFYTNVTWGLIPQGIPVLIKNDLVQDMPLILAALERRPA